MKLSFFLTALLSILLISSCATHEEYPNKWEQIHHLSSTDCVNISGKYNNTGVSSTPGYEPELSWKLFPDYELKNKVTSISFLFQEPEILSITLWNNDEAIYVKDFLKHKNDFYCEDGLIKIKIKKNINREGVLASEWSTLGFSKAKNNLIVKNENGAIGMMFLIPVAGTGTNWYKFEKSK